MDPSTTFQSTSDWALTGKGQTRCTFPSGNSDANPYKMSESGVNKFHRHVVFVYLSTSRI